MKTYKVELTGVSELFFGKPVTEPKQKNETHDQHDARTAHLKINTDPAGNVCIQPFALKNALESAAKRIQRPIPGQGKSTFSKLFRQGILVVDRMILTGDNGKPLKVDDIQMDRLFVPSDGRRGSGKRVWRTFPRAATWRTEATIHVVDPKIDAEVLEEHLIEAGQFVGFGSMRVENGGIAGRFKVDSVSEVA